MRKFINKLTGGEMWVADNRVDEYKAAGHVLAADLIKPEEPIMNEPEPEAEEKAEDVKPEKKPVVKKPVVKSRKR